MKKLQQLLSHKPIFLHDQECLTKEKYLIPFALTDVYTTLAAMDNQPILHFWQLEKAMILGMKDTRVPNIRNGLTSIREAQYEPVIRNAGGLGVVADSGVANLSLILPNNQPNSISIEEAYRLMLMWIKTTFEDREHIIDAFEVTHSYCPGTFDLSINGQKFAGIAQRRVKSGIAILIYLSVNGNQAKRGQLVRQFYDSGLKGQTSTKEVYPTVIPSSMATLEDLFDKEISVAEVKQKLLASLTSSSEISVSTEKINQLRDHSEWFNQEYTRQLQKMIDRNELVLQLN